MTGLGASWGLPLLGLSLGCGTVVVQGLGLRV